MQQYAKEVHKPALKRYPRRVVKAFEVDHIWATDLLDMHEFADENKGYNFILVTIDLFTRYARVVPLKGKSGEVVAEGMRTLFKKRVPYYLWSDQGKEYTGKVFQALLNKYGVGHYHTYSEHKAVRAERFNKTLKSRIYRHITETDDLHWVKYLQAICDEYNKSYNEAIEMSPAVAQTGEHNEMILQKQEELEAKLGEQKDPKFAPGQKVRMSRLKKLFEKSYRPVGRGSVRSVGSLIMRHRLR